MRIAYLCADGGIPVFGEKGGSVHLRAMVKAFRAEGHDVCVIAAEAGDGAPEFEVLSIGPELPPAEGREAKERRLLALAEIMEERLVALHARAPFDLIYERYGLWSAAGVRAARRLDIPVVLEVNAPLVDEQAAFRKFVLQDEARRIEEEVFAGADVVAVVSQPLVDYVCDRGASRAKVHVIGNAVDRTLFDPKITPETVHSIPDHAFTIGFTGSLKAWHGTDILLASLGLLPPDIHPHLLIVGDGPERGQLLDTAAKMGLSRAMTITGWVQHHRLPALIARMDVAVAPYPAAAQHYFSPLKLFEYLAMGRPVVASRIGQCADLLGPGDTGLLVTPGEPAALAEALLRLAKDADFAATLCRRSLELARQHDWRANAQRVIDLLPRKIAA